MAEDAWNARDPARVVRFAYARIASINDTPIVAADRRFLWPGGPRPDDHPSLSDLGF